MQGDAFPGGSGVEVPDRYNVSVLLDRNLEAGRGGKVAIYAGTDEVTYAELFDRACRMAGGLRSLGVGRGDRVLLVLDDTAAFPVSFLGAIRAGAVPVPVAPLYRADTYRYFVEDSGARAVVVDGVFTDKVRGALAGYGEPLQMVVAGGATEASAPDLAPDQQGVHELDALLAAHDGEVPPADTAAADMAFWLYSSGSTGQPKGVVHRQADVPYTCGTYAAQVLGITETDTTFSTTKLFHAYGLGNNLTFPYAVGASTVLLNGRPTPEAVLETAQRHRPTLFFSVPTLYNAMLHWPQASRYDLSSARLCVSAAEPLPAQVWHRWKDVFGLVILDGIGSTEMLHIYCSNRLTDVRPGSSGRPVPGYRVAIRDDAGEPVEAGGVGDLYVSGGSCFERYWGRDEKTRDSLRDGWFRSGDRYRVDGDGFFWYEGRSDDMIKVAGLWVSPIDIENALIEHPAVLEAAVVGIEVEGFTKVKAFVVSSEGVQPDDELDRELQEFSRTRLQRYQYPHVVEFTEELPKTLTGKIQRYKLRERGEGHTDS